MPYSHLTCARLTNCSESGVMNLQRPEVGPHAFECSGMTWSSRKRGNIIMRKVLLLGTLGTNPGCTSSHSEMLTVEAR